VLHTETFPNDYGQAFWVFDDDRFELRSSDEKLLTFLAEMVNPEIRTDEDSVPSIVELLNRHLLRDGYHLVEVRRVSGRPIYAAHRADLDLPSIPDDVDIFSSSYVSRQTARMRDAIKSDPALAIGTAKEFLETLCKTALAEQSLAIPDELPSLLRRTIDALAPTSYAGDDPVRTRKAFERLLGNLQGIGQSVAEFRNACGTGHGQHAATQDVDPVLAQVAVGATITLATFIIEQHRRLRPAPEAPQGDEDVPF